MKKKAEAQYIWQMTATQISAANNANKTVKNANIPNTGAYEAETAFTVVLSAAAGIAVVSLLTAYTLRRKAKNI